MHNYSLPKFDQVSWERSRIVKNNNIYIKIGKKHQHWTEQPLLNRQRSLWTRFCKRKNKYNSIIENSRSLSLSLLLPHLPSSALSTSWSAGARSDPKSKLANVRSNFPRSVWAARASHCSCRGRGSTASQLFWTKPACSRSLAAVLNGSERERIKR